MNSILYYLRKAIAATLGAVLTPIALLFSHFWWTVSTVALTVDDLYERLIRFLSQIFPHVNGLLLLVLVPLLTVTVAALIAAVTALAVAFFVISGIGVVTIAIFEGAETGWNEGFAEVLNIIYNSFKSGQSIFSEEFAVPANRDQEPAIVIDLSTLVPHPRNALIVRL